MSFESKLLTRRRVDFGMIVEAIARRHWERDYFGEIGVDGLFELYRWLTSIVTGKNYGRWSWPTRWTRESLSMNMSSRVNCGAASGTEITPFRSSYDRHQDSRPPHGWRTELASRLVHALLDRGPMAQWRDAMGIRLDKPRSVSMLVYDEPPPPPRAAHICADGYHLGWDTRKQSDSGVGSGLAGEVDRLFGLAKPTRRLLKSPNRYHPEAVYVTAIMLAPRSDGWVTWIEYGLSGSRWCGNWGYAFSKREEDRDPMRCAQKKGEPFANFIYRAHDRFEALLNPPCTKRVTCAPGYHNGFQGVSPSGHPRWQLNETYGGARCEEGP